MQTTAQLGAHAHRYNNDVIVHLHAARPQLRTYGNRRHSGTSISALPHGPLWCFLAMATLSDADIIRTAVGAAAPPQLHSAKVSIRRFPVHTVIFAKQ